MFARLREQVTRTAVSVLLVGVSLAVGTLFVVVGTLSLLGVAGGIAGLVAIVVTLAELGFVATAGVFLLAADGRREYLRVGLPDGRDWRYVIGGLLVTYAVAATGTLVTRAFDGATDLLSPGDLGSSEEFGSGGEFGSAGELGTTSELAGGSVEATLLALVVVSLLVIGPSEELLFRGVIQRYLSGVFSQASAIVVASLLFTAVHVPTFLFTASGLTSVVAAGTIFAISVTLGYSYVRTDNLVVPTVVHGLYDATLFGLVYVGLRTGLF